MGKALTVTQQKAMSIRDYINDPFVVKQLEAALPSFMNADRFLRVFYTVILRNPKLLDCTKESLLSVMIESASLGLEPIMGKAAIIPYKTTAQFQPMYRGLIDLARRTAHIKITAHVVYEKDEFDICMGTEERLHHKPYLGANRGEKIGAYTVWTHENGMQGFLFMPEEEILEIRNNKSSAYQYAKKNPGNTEAQKTPWITDPGEMYKKTVIKRHSKLEPCSIEMERAIEIDNAIDSAETIPPSFLLDPPLDPETEPTKPFKELLPNGMATKNMEKYLQLLAEREGCGVEQIEIEAAKDFDNFLAMFKKWESSYNKPPGLKPSPLSEYYADMAEMKKELGETPYYQVLNDHGFENAASVKNKRDRDMILLALKEVLESRLIPCPKTGDSSNPDTWDMMKQTHCDECLDKEGCQPFQEAIHN